MNRFDFNRRISIFHEIQNDSGLTEWTQFCSLWATFETKQVMTQINVIESICFFKTTFVNLSSTKNYKIVMSGREFKVKEFGIIDDRDLIMQIVATEIKT